MRLFTFQLASFDWNQNTNWIPIHRLPTHQHTTLSSFAFARSVVRSWWCHSPFLREQEHLNLLEPWHDIICPTLKKNQQPTASVTIYLHVSAVFLARPPCPLPTQPHPSSTCITPMGPEIQSRSTVYSSSAKQIRCLINPPCRCAKLISRPLYATRFCCLSVLQNAIIG